MKLKENLINCQEEFQEGLDKGVDLCLRMINDSLGTNYESFGIALARIYQMKSTLESKTDWK
jgi:hypothetical protein